MTQSTTQSETQNRHFRDTWVALSCGCPKMYVEDSWYLGWILPGYRPGEGSYSTEGWLLPEYVHVRSFRCKTVLHLTKIWSDYMFTKLHILITERTFPKSWGLVYKGRSYTPSLRQGLVSTFGKVYGHGIWLENLVTFFCDMTPFQSWYPGRPISLSSEGHWNRIPPDHCAGSWRDVSQEVPLLKWQHPVGRYWSDNTSRMVGLCISILSSKSTVSKNTQCTATSMGWGWVFFCGGDESSCSSIPFTGYTSFMNNRIIGLFGCRNSQQRTL